VQLPQLSKRRFSNYRLRVLDFTSAGGNAGSVKLIRKWAAKNAHLLEGRIFGMLIAA
jgi:hypothetical protein